MSKINHQSTLEAQYYAGKDILKTTKMAIMSRSFGMFTQSLINQKGYKDGMHGFIVACIQFVNSMLMMLKIWEIENQNHDK